MTDTSIVGLNSPVVTAHVDDNKPATDADIKAIKALVADNTAAKGLLTGTYQTKRA